MALAHDDYFLVREAAGENPNAPAGARQVVQAAYDAEVEAVHASALERQARDARRAADGSAGAGKSSEKSDWDKAVDAQLKHPECTFAKAYSGNCN